VRGQWIVSGQMGMGNLFATALKERIVEEVEAKSKSVGKGRIEPAAIATEKVTDREAEDLIPSTPTSNTTSDLTATPETITKALSYLDSLSTVFDSFKRNYRPPTARGRIRDTADLEEAIEHVKDLEDLEESIAGSSPASATPRDTNADQAADEGEMTIIDEKLREIVPPDALSETPRQASLTRDEALIITELLSPTNTIPEVEITIDGVAAEPDSPQMMIEDLMWRAPEVRETYARALAIPKTSNHDECKELLLKMGVPVIMATAPFEAEGLGASLVKAGLADFVGTEDSDVLALSVCSTFYNISLSSADVYRVQCYETLLHRKSPSSIYPVLNFKNPHSSLPRNS
jgi:flap endonuclease-1